MGDTCQSDLGLEIEKEVNINREVSQLGEVVVCGELCMD